MLSVSIRRLLYNTRHSSIHIQQSLGYRIPRKRTDVGRRHSDPLGSRRATARRNRCRVPSANHAHVVTEIASPDRETPECRCKRPGSRPPRPPARSSQRLLPRTSSARRPPGGTSRPAPRRRHCPTNSTRSVTPSDSANRSQHWAMRPITDHRKTVRLHPTQRRHRSRLPHACMAGGGRQTTAGDVVAAACRAARFRAATKLSLTPFGITTVRCRELPSARSPARARPRVTQITACRPPHCPTADNRVRHVQQAGNCAVRRVVQVRRYDERTHARQGPQAG